jgi:hypothetical protein
MTHNAMTNSPVNLNLKTRFMLPVFFAFLISCNNQGTDLTLPVNDDSTNTVVAEIDTCEQKSNVADFDNFLGLTYGMNELMLEKKLGKFTGGEYTADSTSFMYYFKKIKGAPITVWVDSKSQKVITIFMEILGYEELFQSDLNSAIEAYSISTCDSYFFGLKYEDLKAKLGEPTTEELLEGNIRSVDYDSEDLKCAVNFKFYPEQGNLCSSISVNWFY